MVRSPLLFPSLCLVPLISLFPIHSVAQQYGKPADPGLGAVDVIQAFHLPSLKDAAGSPVENIVAALQVGKRAKLLGITSNSAIDAWNGAQMLVAENPPPISSRILSRTNPVVFNGTTASALNQLLGQPNGLNVRVTSDVLTVDQPIEIQRSGVTLDLGGAQLMGFTRYPYMIRIEGSSNVTVLHGSFITGDSGVLVSGSSGVTITGLQIGGITGAGIVVTGSTHVAITNNTIASIGMAGIMLHRGTSLSIVQGNQISSGAGASNLMAAIVLTDREVDVTQNPRAVFGPGGYSGIGQPMLQRMNPPHDNAIVGNQLLRNSSSGIYSDGGVRNVLALNTIQSNAKEGLCLDNGSTANVVASNVIQENGGRWGEPDSVLALEFILGAGRLADGTPVEKVPGISIDNAIYNVIYANSVAHNFGGGVKMVRTSYFNVVGLNTLLSDNEGMSDKAHFFGIELGAAAGDASSVELDFTPSRGNIVFANNIRGKHFSGIFFAGGSDQNDIVNNVIFDAYNWALESAQAMQNNPVNNLTDLPSRNIGSGLDSALVTKGQPVNDPPPM